MDSQATHTVANANDVLLRLRGATVTVTKGPDAGRTVKIEQPTFLIGKGDAADLQLTDPSVSREHLRLSLMPNGIQLRDTSKNGTKIGGLRVVEAVLGADAVLTLGQTTLNIAIDAEPLTLPLSTSVTFGEAIGSSPVMRHLFAVLEQGAAA
jgi:pSer/pThr/pTyr-binding forkhead associated (FHA) protein